MTLVPGAGVLAAALTAVTCLFLLPPGPGRPVRRLARLTPGTGGWSSRSLRLASGRSPAIAPRASGRSAGTALPGPVLLDLVAAVLAAGAPVGTALRVVGEAAGDHGDAGAREHLLRLADRHDLGLEVAQEGPAWAAVLAEALLLAREAGVAAAPLLTAAAAQERRRQAGAARVAAARLGVRVVLPTGLCLLPAFVLLAVVPLVLALLGVS